MAQPTHVHACMHTWAYKVHMYGCLYIGPHMSMHSCIHGLTKCICMDAYIQAHTCPCMHRCLCLQSGYVYNPDQGLRWPGLYTVPANVYMQVHLVLDMDLHLHVFGYAQVLVHMYESLSMYKPCMHMNVSADLDICIYINQYIYIIHIYRCSGLQIYMNI